MIFFPPPSGSKIVLKTPYGKYEEEGGAITRAIEEREREGEGMLPRSRTIPGPPTYRGVNEWRQ